MEHLQASLYFADGGVSVLIFCYRTDKIGIVGYCCGNSGVPFQYEMKVFL